MMDQNFCGRVSSFSRGTEDIEQYMIVCRYSEDSNPTFVQKGSAISTNSDCKIETANHDE